MMFEPRYTAAPQAAVNSYFSSASNPLVNLNSVVENLLQRYLKDVHQGQLVARCEALPAVAGEAEALKRLFEIILALILRKDQPVPTRYLHIDCCEVEPLDVEIVSGETPETFCIEFKSNHKPEIDVEGCDRVALESCNEILDEHGGTMQIICDSEGCLLRLLLRGKMS